jgi:chemotaxis methyl-accepting protein methylase
VVDGFDPSTRAKVVERLSRALTPDGWLLLGAQEAAPAGFAAAGAAGLFRRKLAAVEAA